MYFDTLFSSEGKLDDVFPCSEDKRLKVSIYMSFSLRSKRYTYAMQLAVMFIFFNKHIRYNCHAVQSSERRGCLSLETLPQVESEVYS